MLRRLSESSRRAAQVKTSQVACTPHPTSHSATLLSSGGCPGQPGAPSGLSLQPPALVSLCLECTNLLRAVGHSHLLGSLPGVSSWCLHRLAAPPSSLCSRLTFQGGLLRPTHSVPKPFPSPAIILFICLLVDHPASHGPKRNPESRAGTVSLRT